MRVRRWPVWLIAAPAAVAIWSGWVGLGELTGFGEINPLPGTPLDGWTLDTAITLPVGMEVYAAYALRVWLSGGLPVRAQAFAKWSAIAALVLGAAGQVAYHLMTAAGVTAAPWWITTLVACMPVAVLGAAATLAHLLAEPVADSDTTAEAAGDAVEDDTERDTEGDAMSPPEGDTEDDIQHDTDSDTGHDIEDDKPQVKPKMSPPKRPKNVVSIKTKKERALEGYAAGDMTQAQAAELAGVTVRTFQRWLPKDDTRDASEVAR